MLHVEFGLQIPVASAAQASVGNRPGGPVARKCGVLAAAQPAADHLVELAWAPKTRIQGGVHLKLDGAEAGTEPLGNRIVESPIDARRTEFLRDPRSGFIAYVPVGSIEKGEDHLTSEDMLNIAAYTASLPPVGAAGR